MSGGDLRLPAALKWTIQTNAQPASSLIYHNRNVNYTSVLAGLKAV